MPAGWVPRAAVAALSLAIVVQAAEISIGLSRLARDPRVPGPVALPVMPSHRGGAHDIVAAHLFGQIAMAPTDSAVSAAEHWVLSGTLEGKTPAVGSAILGPTVEKTRFCLVGQEVSGGFRLAEVFSDHVTLERAGVRVSVRLPHTPLGRGARLALAMTPETPVSDADTEVERQVAPPAALLELRPSLEWVRGKKGRKRSEGMRVSGDGRDLAAVGLRYDDIIRTVDGQPIDGLDAQERALETLSQGKPVPITVERNGTVFTLQVGFSDNGG